MAQEADMAAPSLQAGMLPEKVRVVDVVQVGIDDRLAIQCHPRMPALIADLFMVPGAGRLQGAAPGGKQAVDRAAELPRLEVRILRRRVVQDLDLHARVRGVALQGRAYADPVVGAGV